MKLTSHTLRHGMSIRRAQIDQKNVLIYSKENSAGKTTLIRSIMLAMGYPVPSLKGIDFAECLIKSELDVECKKVTVEREGTLYKLHKNGEALAYSNVYPEDGQKELFGLRDSSLLGMMPALFYFDQEKGGTLLNRGRPTSSNKINFNIEKYVLALSGFDYAELDSKIESLEEKIRKYKSIRNVSKYSNADSNFDKNGQRIAFADEVAKSNVVLHSRLKSLKKEKTDLEGMINKNSDFFDFLEEMEIHVESSSGEIIPVTRSRVLNYSDNENFLWARVRKIVQEIGSTSEQLKHAHIKNEREDQLFSIEESIDDVSQLISSLNIPVAELDKIIESLSSKKRVLSKERAKLINTVGSDAVREISSYCEEYVQELGLVDVYDKEYGIFTKNLKALSGAVLFKMVFAYRLAFLKSFERRHGINLPIIIDSPYGREITSENVNQVLSIIKRDFSAHQIIVASIHKIDLGDMVTIDLTEGLFQEFSTD